MAGAEVRGQGGRERKRKRETGNGTNGREERPPTPFSLARFRIGILGFPVQKVWNLRQVPLETGCIPALFPVKSGSMKCDESDNCRQNQADFVSQYS